MVWVQGQLNRVSFGGELRKVYCLSALRSRVVVLIGIVRLEEFLLRGAIAQSRIDVWNQLVKCTGDIIGCGIFVTPFAQGHLWLIVLKFEQVRVHQNPIGVIFCRQLMPWALLRLRIHVATGTCYLSWLHVVRVMDNSSVAVRLFAVMRSATVEAEVTTSKLRQL